MAFYLGLHCCLAITYLSFDLQVSSAKIGTIYFLWMSLKTAMSIANDVDPVQTLLCVALYLGLHCCLAITYLSFDLHVSSAKIGTIYYLWMSLRTAGSVAYDVDPDKTPHCMASYLGIHHCLAITIRIFHLQVSSAKIGTIYYLWMRLKTAGFVANDVDHNQTPPCSASYISLHCLLRPNFPQF